MLSKLKGFLLGVGLVAAGLAAAQYVGFNPATNLAGVVGIPVAVGTTPTIDASSSCGTLATVQASVLGGGSVFQFTANATSCTVKVDIPTVTVNGVVSQPASTNGLYCVAADETTTADSMKQSAHTTTSCTLTGTVVSGDKIIVEVNGF